MASNEIWISLARKTKVDNMKRIICRVKFPIGCQNKQVNTWVLSITAVKKD